MVPKTGGRNLPMVVKNFISDSINQHFGLWYVKMWFLVTSHCICILQKYDLDLVFEKYLILRRWVQFGLPCFWQKFNHAFSPEFWIFEHQKMSDTVFWSMVGSLDNFSNGWTNDSWSNSIVIAPNNKDRKINSSKSFMPAVLKIIAIVQIKYRFPE